MEGRKYFSLSVSPKEAAPVPQKKATTFDQLDDDIPNW
jgi:hypothetical protein